MEDLLTYYRSEIDRLQRQLMAERSHNSRLMVAVAHLKEAAGRASEVVDAARSQAEDGRALESDYLTSAREAIDGIIENADDLLLPLGVSVG